MILISSEGAEKLKEHAERRERIRELLAKYPEPWMAEKETHTMLTNVRYRKSPKWVRGEEVAVDIGRRLTPDLAELLILLREHALETI
jgi:hypothetical protein